MVIRDGNRWVYALFAVVVLSSALGNLSQTGLNAMLVAVCADYGVGTGVGQWLTTIYMFVLGIVVPLSSYLMGRFTTKTLASASILAFAIGALLAALAPNFGVLLAGRIVQALAAGVLMPLMTTIAMVYFPQGRKATAMGIAGIAMGFAPNIGPTIGGAMVDEWGWRSFFWLLLALSVALLAFCQACIARHDDASYPAGLDVFSFVLSTVGFGGVLLGCSNASSFSFASPFVWVPLLAGGACIALFVRRQHRVENPLIDLAIFRDSGYTSAFWAQCFLGASFMGVTLLVPLYIQGLCGGTALESGMVLLPGTIAALIFNPLAGYLTDRVGIRPVALVFGLCLAVGSASMVLCDETTPLWLVCVMQGVRSTGVSGLIGPLLAWGVAGLKGKMVADGNAFCIAVRQTFASVGTALMVLCAAGLPMLTGAAAYHAAFAVSALFALATFACIMWKVR